MRLALLACATLALAACERELHEFDVAKPMHIVVMPPPSTAPGRSHEPYTGMPKYLAAARPLRPTTSTTCPPGAHNPCAFRSQVCDDRLRGVLTSIDGEILTLSTPPTELQLSALRLDVDQLGPLLAPYPDMASERDELGQLVGKLPSMTMVDQMGTRRRMTELADLLRVQLAAAQ